MNEYQQELWNNLMALVENNEAFYYADQELSGYWFRIFNYRLASYTDFLQPGALECRGTTFLVNEEGPNSSPVELVSLPFHKFFNLHENPSTMDINLSDVVEIATKMDGSLISTFLIGDQLMLKSKGSLFSDQAVAASEWLSRPENEKFKNELIGAERAGYTVIMEWISPDNRIVIGYEQQALVVLGVRSRQLGAYLYYDEIDGDVFPEILGRWTMIMSVTKPSEFLSAVPDMNGIEGFVCRLENNELFKLKCEAYLALHHIKDTINSPRRLFEAVLEEASDDLRSLFYDDQQALALIEDMEHFVEMKYNHMVDQVERFYKRNKHLDRKSYAILGQKELDRMYFSLAMNRYLGREFSYKEFLKGKWKQLGLKDEIEDE